MTLLERDVDLDVAIDQAWALVGDVPRSASCLPGLTAGEALDARSFRCSMRVPAGFFTLRYAGTLRVDALDPERRLVRFTVTGKAAAGRTIDVRIAVAAAALGEAASRLEIVIDVALDAATSLVAGPMVRAAGEEMLGGFARNVKQLLEKRSGQAPPRTAG